MVTICDKSCRFAFFKTTLIKYHFQLDKAIISLIAFDEVDLLDAKSKVEQFIARTNVTKIIECKDQEMKFIMKHLLPITLIAKETSVGLEVVGSSAEVQNCNVLMIIHIIDLD